MGQFPQACIYVTVFQLSPDSNNKIHTTVIVISVDWWAKHILILIAFFDYSLIAPSLTARLLKLSLTYPFFLMKAKLKQHSFKWESKYPHFCLDSSTPFLWPDICILWRWLPQRWKTKTLLNIENPHACVLSHVWVFAPPWTVACKALPSVEFSRQEY